MSVFPDQTCQFLSDLAENNNKQWFEENRNRYESDWLEPAKTITAELSSIAEQLSPVHKAEPRINGTIRKIHRDVRFSKDKTPFDPKLHLIFWTGDHPNRSPAIHLVLQKDRLGMGAGQFALTPEELENYRRTICENPDQAKALIEILATMLDYKCDLTEETLKTVPRGFVAPEGLETLMKRKGLVVRTHAAPFAPSKIGDREFIKGFFTQSARLNGWMTKNLN